MDPPYRVAVIGLGYVGLSLAAAIADAGIAVVGIETRSEIRIAVNEFRAPFLERGLEVILRKVRLPVLADMRGPPLAAAYVICVGTPLMDDAGALRGAVTAVAENMPDDATVIIRSTVKIGTTRAVVEPILKMSGKTFHLAVCPERTVEGEALSELHSLPQIIGGPQPATLRAMGVFRNVAPETVIDLTWEEAEAAKLLANAWRDVTFGFANEVAALAHEKGFRAWAVIGAANHRYPRCAIPAPGPAGGPCLTKDSFLLAEGRQDSLWALARERNAAVPWDAADRIMEIARRRKTPAPAVLVLGTAFKGRPDTDDVRGSPSLQLVRALMDLGCTVWTMDPLAPADMNTLEGRVSRHHTPAGPKYDVIVVANNNPRWLTIRYEDHLEERGFVYDLCGVLKASPTTTFHRYGG